MNMTNSSLQIPDVGSTLEFLCNYYVYAKTWAIYLISYLLVSLTRSTVLMCNSEVLDLNSSTSSHLPTYNSTPLVEVNILF